MIPIECEYCAAQPMGSCACEQLYCKVRGIHAEEYKKSKKLDPWLHRSDKMRCKTCMWFILKNKGFTLPEKVNGAAIGRCRRHAPTMNGYPVVFEDDWCGDNKLDENKI
jgi:hypothetical protein